MTEPAPSRGSSPLRMAGFALLGLGVVAGLIWIATLVIDGGTGDPTATPSASASPTPTAEATPTGAGTPTGGATPTTDGTVPLPSFSATPSPNVAAPPPAASTPDRGAGGGRLCASGGGAGARSPLRVYNNSNIENLAAQGAEDFRAAGWTVTETKGYPHGIVPTSTVYYRPGTSEQAPAEALANEFGLRSKPRFEGIQDASPGLIVILTRDYQRR